jgi:hypothetical protein
MQLVGKYLVFIRLHIILFTLKSIFTLFTAEVILIRLLVLIPFVLCLVWFLFLKLKGHSLGEGKQGFVYIFIFSTVIAAFYTSLLWLTR